MRENTLRKKLAAGQPIINGWLAIPSSYSAEVMGHQGFDSVTVDLQHGMINLDTNEITDTGGLREREAKAMGLSANLLQPMIRAQAHLARTARAWACVMALACLVPVQAQVQAQAPAADRKSVV